MGLQESITESLRTFMVDSYGLDVARVLDWEDDTEGDGYCDTCYYEYAVVRVRYQDSQGVLCDWTYGGSFADLIANL